MPSAPSTTSPNIAPSQLSSAAQPTPNQHGILSPGQSLHRPQHGPGDEVSPSSGRLGQHYPTPDKIESPAEHILNSPRLRPSLPARDSSSLVNRKSHSGEPYIANLPNEVLTHTLSFLDPVSLTSVSFVSRRFRALVTSPHAWKDAFARYFPQHNTPAGSDVYPTTARYYTRLSELGTHRSEYILRTQLLRSLKRGRPSLPQGVKPSSSNSNFSMITYNPKLHESTITHLHANFAKNRVIAASQYTGLFSHSDPRTGYVTVDQRGHPGYSSFGLQYISPDGIGALDLSEPRGQIIGDAREAPPSFFVERAGTDNPPVRFVTDHGPGASITCVWLAKKDTIVNTSGGSIVSASGSSKGVVQFQDAAGKWISFAVCPGIPILQLRLDDGYTKARERRDRIWCILINALGEVWYMKGKFPKYPSTHNFSDVEESPTDFRPWHYIPSTKKENSPVGIGILEPLDTLPSTDAIQQHEILMHTEPEVMATTYSEHWSEDYFLEADFGGQNFVAGCKGGEGSVNSNKRRAEMSRYSRILDNNREDIISEVFIKHVYKRGSYEQVEESVARPSDEIEPPDTWGHTTLEIPRNTGKDYAFITAIAIDMSSLALLSPNEDSLLKRPPTDRAPTPQQVPGQLARLFAIGTYTGSIHVYNIRHPLSTSPEASLPPLHSIATASPSISSLALSSLYLVHGGTDGLVQAWDPLVSITEPIRAIHSRFSTRARRRLAQAALSVHGIGENQFAARAIFLDPDPTSLRGIVALGTQIRSWSFGTSAEKVQENSNARRRRRNPRTNNPYLANAGATRVKTGNSSKSPLPRDIMDETDRIAHTRRQDAVTKLKLAARFGVGHDDMKGMTEDEMVMYAMMMSEESFEKERGLSDEAFTGSSSSMGSVGVESSLEDAEMDELWVHGDTVAESPSSGNIISSPVPDSSPLHGQPTMVNDGTDASANTLDDEALAKALQESFDLQDHAQSPVDGVDIPIKYAKKKNNGKGKKVAVGIPNSEQQNQPPSSGDEQFDRDLELAIRLSMVGGSASPS
ncbi:hypothetical protein Dda_6319 [Drechslerella dactyloides]|uniref:F-box domain-containing protein n=1 Tax=Drechslerella dactyloides TaxID=74499 RepID=A0AAD6NII0_DREDA|nr:hypothetical protein Dda_6319 [Drechslerella dactyloides]